MPCRRNSRTNGWNVGQDGVVVMSWDFWLMWLDVCFSAEMLSTRLPRRSEKTWHREITIDAASTDYLQSVMLVCCSWLKLECLLEQTCRTDCRSWRPGLRLQQASSWPRNECSSFVRYLQPPCGKLCHADPTGRPICFAHEVQKPMDPTAVCDAQCHDTSQSKFYAGCDESRSEWHGLVEWHLGS